jgi:hypothetical protein
MTTPALTLSYVTTLDKHIPDLRLLKFALDCKEQEIGKRAVMVSAAWKLFDVAVDEGQSAEVKNELAKTAEDAEAALSQAKAERNEIKAELLAQGN